MKAYLAVGLAILLAAIPTTVFAQLGPIPGLPLSGGTLTGALHLGTNVLDGSAIAFTGGTLNGVAIGGTTPSTVAGTTGNFTGLLTLTGGASIQGNVTGSNNTLTFPTVNAGNNRTLTASGALTPAFYGQIGQLAGSVTSPTVPSVFEVSIGGDVADGHTLSNQLVGFLINDTFGNSALMEGSRVGLSVVTGLAAGTQTGNKTAGISPIYGGANFWETIHATEGGTGLTTATSNGSAINLNPQLVFTSAATDWTEGSIAEYDIGIQSGASVVRKFGIKLTQLNTDVVQGTIADAGLKFGGQTGAVGWKNSILFGGDQSPWTATQTLLKAEYSTQQLTAPNTISGFAADLLEVSLPAFASTGGLIRGPGFAVGGDAVMQDGTALFSPSSSGLSIDAKGSIETAVSINSGGTSCAAGDILDIGSNGRVVVNSANSGVVATYTVLDPPYDFSGSPPATLSATAYPSSPGPCTGVVFNVTWSARTLLTFNPSGGAVKFGSGAFTANGSTVLALSNIGPSGAHATVQEWLTITDAGGTVRYIPAF
jgi:hypothetical protein